MMCRVAGGMLCFFLVLGPLFAQDGAKSLEERRRDTIRYGTDAEILELIGTLGAEKSDTLDGELTAVMESTTNSKILAGIFGFFAERGVAGLEGRALRAIENRDDESGATLSAAIEYLGKLKIFTAMDALKDILDAEEKKYTNAAVRAIGRVGRAGGEDAAAAAADYLIAYYQDREVPDELKREIVVALGDLGAVNGVDFLASIAENEDERAFRRIAALEALEKIGDEAGLAAVLSALGSQDANVRAAAVGALGPFTGKKAEEAIIESFRDSFYKTRISAASAAGRRRLEKAVPYLRYRAERDDVAAVKDAAVRALGAVGGGAAMDALSELFSERAFPDRVRILAAEQLLEADAPRYVEKVIAEMDEAKAKKRNALYAGLAKALSTAESQKLQDLATRFLSGGDVVEKAYGLEMASRNGFRALADLIRPLTDEKNGSLSRRAKDALEKLGLE